MLWIEDVFYHDGTPFVHRGSLTGDELEKAKREWRAAAAETLEATGTDHVVYCTVEYSPDNTPVEVNFYMEPMNDATFYERTEAAAAEAHEKDAQCTSGRYIGTSSLHN